MARIYFIYPDDFTFIQMDLEILRAAHEVRECKFGYGLLPIFTKFFEIICETLRADIVISWFGAQHALIPFLIARLKNIPRIVIASGYDVANAGEINYGNMRPGIRRIIGRTVFGLSTKIIPVSRYTMGEIRGQFPEMMGKVELIYHGFPFIEIPTMERKREIVITIGTIKTSSFHRKGIASFIKAAHYLPDVHFKLIGKICDDVKNTVALLASPNIEFTGYVDSSILWMNLSQAKVYVQSSYHEAFGCAVAEAMLYGCIPVVTNRGALPEVVGDTGVIVPYGDPQGIAEGIKKALNMEHTHGLRARNRILACFPLEDRKRKLLDVIKGQLNEYGA